jgi:hypothetical protein
VDRAVLGAGEKALLTVRIYNDGAQPLADLALTLLHLRGCNRLTSAFG